MLIPWLGDHPQSPFPDARQTMPWREGLLAAGGDLHPQRLLNAYRQGIFPWFSSGEPILWWSPDPRMVFRNEGFQPSRRALNEIAGQPWTLRCDSAFEQVIRACAEQPRPGQRGTWITLSMQNAYCQLHHLGDAHSIEVFEGSELIGGLYGVVVGRLFCGESMFSKRSGASKFALLALRTWMREAGWPLLDGQVENEHLRRMGAEAIPREDYLSKIAYLVDSEGNDWDIGRRLDGIGAADWAESQRPARY